MSEQEVQISAIEKTLAGLHEAVKELRAAGPDAKVRATVSDLTQDEARFMLEFLQSWGVAGVTDGQHRPFRNLANLTSE